jgi:hypothetical protein
MVLLVNLRREEPIMNKALRLSALAIAGATTTGLIGYTAPALASDGGGAVYKRDDSSGQVVSTVDDGDDDGPDDTNTGTNGDTATAMTSTGSDGTSTGTGNNTGSDHTRTNTGTRTRGGDTDHSRIKKVKDLTNDGPGRNNVDDSRGHTNDGTRHNTRG